MSRLDELTQLAIEGALSPDDGRELQALLDADPSAWVRHRQLLDVEMALRELDERFDVSDAVMDRLAAEAPPRLELLPPPPAADLAPFVGAESGIERWIARLVIPVAAAAGLAIALALIGSRQGPERPGFAAIEGSVEIQRADSKRAAAPGTRAESRDRIVVAPASKGSLAFRDRTNLSLSARTELVMTERLPHSGRRSKCLELVTGTLRAEVASQPTGSPLVVRTPHALAIVRGTRFTLSTDGDRTRLDVAEGRVDFQRADGSGSPIPVEAGRFAEIGRAADTDPVARDQRVSRDLIALYTFEEGDGDRVRDRSGHGVPLDLHLAGDPRAAPEWLPGGGVRFQSGAYLATPGPAEKIIAACRDSGALTVETWIEPASRIGKGPGRIVTLSRASHRVNFLLGQGTSQGDPDRLYTVRLRTGPPSRPVDEWTAPPGSAASGLAHLVLTRDSAGREALHLDGRVVVTAGGPGDFSGWFDDLRLSLSDDPGDPGRHWAGACRLAAIYSRALTEDEIRRNFAAGPDHRVPLSGIANQ